MNWHVFGGVIGLEIVAIFFCLAVIKLIVYVDRKFGTDWGIASLFLMLSLGVAFACGHLASIHP